MRYKSSGYVFILILLMFFAPVCVHAQGGVDAVAISSKYYNSIVKILLYDSASKTSPEKAYLGRGSGFFVSEDGYIFTNRHVIADTYYGFCRFQTYDEESKKYEDNIDTYTPALLRDVNVSKITAVGRAAIIVQVFTDARGDSSKLYHAQVVALDTLNFDGAIIKINTDMNGNPVTDKFHPLPLGNSDSIKQGQDLCLFGFPAQYGGNFDLMLKDLSTLILGKHSGYDYTYNSQYGFIKTDAAINSGNSGGPVFGPSNKVIGIATAAFEKTNVGLIGGIDAMYYVSALIPELQRVVTANGLAAPTRPPGVVTASLYKPKPLPTAKMIKKANNMSGKKGNAANKAYVIFDLSYGVMSSTKFSIAPYIDANYSTNGGGSFNVPAQEFGFGLRVIKPTFLKQTNNLLGYFFDFSPSVFVPNWQTAQLFTPAPFSLVKSVNMNGTEDINNAEIGMYFSFGLSYTYLFVKDVSINVYYGPGVQIVPGGQITMATASGPNVTKDIQYSRDPVDFINNAGLIFRYKALFLGLSYRFGLQTKVQYTMPDVTGSTANTFNIGGTSSRSVLSATLGFKI